MRSAHTIKIVIFTRVQVISPVRAVQPRARLSRHGSKKFDSQNV